MRPALGSFLPEVEELFLSDPTLPSEAISLILTNHFPETIHEDILAAFISTNCRPRSQKGIQGSEKKFCAPTDIAARCAALIYD